MVDAKDVCYGAWFEGKIVSIMKDSTIKEKCQDESINGDGLLYKVKFIR